MKKAAMDIGLTMRLVGATFGAIGFYLMAFNKPIIGATLLGIGGVLLAAGGS